MRALRIAAWIVATPLLLALLAATVVLVGLNTDTGRRLGERLVAQATGGEVTVSGLAGTFPAAPRFGQLVVRDADGPWLTVHDAALDWSPLRLLSGEARVQALTVARVVVARRPVASTASGPAASGQSGLPVRVELERLHVDRLELAEPVIGAPAALTLDGNAHLASLEQGQATLELKRLDAPGSYRLNAALDGPSIDFRLAIQEPAHGLISQAAALPELGAIAATASLVGPRTAAALRLAATAGPLRADATGTLDLNALSGSLDATASAPAMQPRPDLSWQGITLQAHVNGRFDSPEIDATLHLAGLEAAQAGLRDLSVRAFGRTGVVNLDASAEGVRVPGPDPLVLASAPLGLVATLELKAPGRLLTFSLTHPLVRIEGTARTDGTRSAEARISLPDLGPLAAVGGVDLAGHAGLVATAAQAADGIHVTLDGMVGVSGGMSPVPALLGEDARLGLIALLHGSDATLSRLRLDGRTLTAQATGTLNGGVVALDWQLGLSDLAALGGTVQGSLAATGHAGGRSDDLSVTADLDGTVGTAGTAPSPVHATIAAEGLPGHPTGSVTAGGTLDGAPLALAAELRRLADGTLNATITRADWRSTHAEGQLELPPGAVLPLGTMTLRVGDLSDLSRFAGQRMTGSIDADLRTEQQQGTSVAVLALTARNAGLPGRAFVGEARLAARVRDPTGARQSEARLDVTGLRAGDIGGRLRLDANGNPEALVLGLAATLTGVSGADLSARSAATLNATARTLAVSSLEATWKSQTLRLLAPARLSFADGIAVDRARLGLGGAVLEVAGRASPTLDLTVALTNVTPDLARILVPDLRAEGRLEARAKLGGTQAQPTGTLHLAMTGLHMLSGPAAGLPAASLTADATLRGSSARLDAAMNAGGNRLTLTGTAPLAKSEPMDLHAAGQVDLAIFNPILGASGRQVRGRLTLDAAVTGTLAAPRADGTLRLAGGEVQDFAIGAHLRNIEAVVQGSGESIRIASLTAQAGNGSLSASGTVGLAAPMPVALRLTARDATPLASDRLTAVLGGDLAVSGDALGRLVIGGNLRIARADIRVPESMPTKVAVLQVRRPGQKPPPPSSGPEIGLDLTLAAARVFVRGRGLDAELAGTLHIAGTTTAPRPTGSFNLVRGQFSLAGSTLTFTQGKVGFDGSGKIDPTLDFVATSNNGNITATLTITGYASAPKIALSSVPELPQDEVLSQLLFHQASSSLGPLQLAQIAQAVAQIAGVGGGGGGPLEALRSRLGLSQLSLGSGPGGKGTGVQAGTYVAQGVYVGAKQSVTGSGTQATVQVDLAKGLKLETTVGQQQDATGAASSSQDQGTSVGLTYQFQY